MKPSKVFSLRCKGVLLNGSSGERGWLDEQKRAVGKMVDVTGIEPATFPIPSGRSPFFRAKW
jgi:hypothetical protein